MSCFKLDRQVVNLRMVYTIMIQHVVIHLGLKILRWAIKDTLRSTKVILYKSHRMSHIILTCFAHAYICLSEKGKKHRKHRAPVCIAEKTTDDLTLLRGKRAGNFTNIGDVGDFGMCIKRCCQNQNCDLAFKSAETCFLVSCFSQESCQTSPAIDDIFSPQMSFVKRHSRDSDKGNRNGLSLKVGVTITCGNPFSRA